MTKVTRTAPTTIAIAASTSNEMVISERGIIARKVTGSVPIKMKVRSPLSLLPSYLLGLMKKHTGLYSLPYSYAKLLYQLVEPYARVYQVKG